MSWSVLSLCARGPFCSVSMMIHCSAWHMFVTYARFFLPTCIHAYLHAHIYACDARIHTYVHTYRQQTDIHIEKVFLANKEDCPGAL